MKQKKKLKAAFTEADVGDQGEDSRRLKNIGENEKRTQDK